MATCFWIVIRSTTNQTENLASKARRTSTRFDHDATQFSQSVGAVFSAHLLHEDLSLTSRNRVATDSACLSLCKLALRFKISTRNVSHGNYGLALECCGPKGSYRLCQKVCIRSVCNHYCRINEREAYIRFISLHTGIWVITHKLANSALLHFRQASS